MGMFNYIRSWYPLPVAVPEPNRYWQTKDIGEYLFLDHYEIRDDGWLWRERYDVEDRSDPNAKGLRRMFRAAMPVNKRWEPYGWTGTARFYGSRREDLPFEDGGWIEFEAVFVAGRLMSLQLIQDRDLKNCDFGVS